MRLFPRIIFVSIILLNLSCFLFGQEMSTKQKQIIEKIEQRNKIEEVKRREIRKQLKIDEPPKTSKSKETKKDFFWQNGVGLTTKNITQKRALNRYVRGGHIDCREWATKDEISFDCKEKKLRDFIWQCWIEKKRGYITISGDSRDSSSTSHLFIELTEKGTPQVFWRTVIFSALPGINFWIQDNPKIVSVERIENNSQKGQWTLALKDKSGKEIKKLS